MPENLRMESTVRASQAELSARLRAAVENAAAVSAESTEQLRLAIAQFTVALRDAGASPEAVLISLKAVINAQAFPPPWQVSTWHGPRLQGRMSTWCIEEYFSEKPSLQSSGK